MKTLELQIRECPGSFEIFVDGRVFMVPKRALWETILALLRENGLVR